MSQLDSILHLSKSTYTKLEGLDLIENVRERTQRTVNRARAMCTEFSKLNFTEKLHAFQLLGLIGTFLFLWSRESKL